MSPLFTGSCACEDIKYTCSGEPLYMGNCHCRDCQRATGSAFYPGVLFKETDFTLLHGEPVWYESLADRGHIMQRGSPLFLINEASSGIRLLYASSLDDPSLYKPQRDIYVASAQPWDIMDPNLPKFEGMPDMKRK
jgi:hypothetical protein